MQKLLITCAFATLLQLTAYCQGANWKIDVDTEILYSTISENGLHALFIYEDDNDSINLVCIDAINGIILWKQVLTDIKREDYELCKFVVNDMLFFPQKNQYKFINTESGLVEKTIPIIGESWDDLKKSWSFNQSKFLTYPYTNDSIGIFYFDEGFQIIDFKKMEIAYQTSETPSEAIYEYWENTLFINLASGSDTLYFFDLEKKKISYKMPLDKHEINSTVFQKFAIHNNELIIFTEDEIQCIDLQDSKLITTINVDPDNIGAYTLVILKNKLHILLSHENKQYFYRISDGKMLWETKENVFPGIVESALEVPGRDGDCIVLSYEEDGRIMARRIQMNTGEILWGKLLCIQDGNYNPGHKPGSSTGRILASIALSILVRGVIIIPETINAQENEYYTRYKSSLYNSWISQNKETDGYVTILDIDPDKFTVITAGSLYSPENKNQDNYDGEGVWTYNISDGLMQESQRKQILVDEDRISVNAYRKLLSINFDSIQTQAILGLHDIYIAKKDTIINFNFGESRINFISKTKTDFVIVADSYKEHFDYWNININTFPPERSLIARSTQANVVFPMPDTTQPYLQNYLNTSSLTLLISDEEIIAYPRKTGSVDSLTFSSPLWKLSEYEMDSLDLGGIEHSRSYFDGTQGIFFFSNDVVVMGDDGIGIITDSGKCKWSQEWDMMTRTGALGKEVFNGLMGVHMTQDRIMYVTKSKATLLNNACKGSIIAEEEIDYNFLEILKSKDAPTFIIIVNTEEGTLSGYSLYN